MSFNNIPPDITDAMRFTVCTYSFLPKSTESILPAAQTGELDTDSILPAAQTEALDTDSILPAAPTGNLDKEPVSDVASENTHLLRDFSHSTRESIKSNVSRDIRGSFFGHQDSMQSNNTQESNARGSDKEAWDRVEQQLATKTFGTNNTLNSFYNLDKIKKIILIKRAEENYSPSVELLRDLEEGMCFGWAQIMALLEDETFNSQNPQFQDIITKLKAFDGSMESYDEYFKGNYELEFFLTYLFQCHTPDEINEQGILSDISKKDQYRMENVITPDSRLWLKEIKILNQEKGRAAKQLAIEQKISALKKGEYLIVNAGPEHGKGHHAIAVSVDTESDGEKSYRLLNPNRAYPPTNNYNAQEISKMTDLIFEGMMFTVAGLQRTQERRSKSLPAKILEKLRNIKICCSPSNDEQSTIPPRRNR